MDLRRLTTALVVGMGGPIPCVPDAIRPSPCTPFSDRVRDEGFEPPTYGV